MKRTLISALIITAIAALPLHAQAADFETAAAAVKNMGVGWNLGNTLDANSQKVTDLTDPSYWGQQDLSSETCWGQFVTKPDVMKMLKDAGFGAIRVPVTWYNHMDAQGNVDPAWMARVHEVVDYVINQGLYCIVNVHHDTGADGSGFTSWLKADETYYAQNRERFEGLWRQIAEEFKDYGQRLLFESYNEMLDTYNSWCYATFASPQKYDEKAATSAYNAINAYAQSFVNTVRATGGNNAQRNLVVNTYCASNGYGNWNKHLPEPLINLKKPEGETDHIAFEVHAYPSIANSNNTDRPIADIRNEVDGMISLLKTHLVSKGVPVIFGEWGTSNVDSSEPDYVKRPALMKQFCQYFVRQCKANDMGTFYWMGITDGAARIFPVFSQADLALWILQAYHGDDYNPVLLQRSDLKNTCIACTVDYNQQWSELNLISDSFTSADYYQLVLELEEAPATNLLQIKVYGKSESYTTITAATTTITFTAAMGTISRITLQCMKQSGSAKVKSVWLVKKGGERAPSDPSVFWGCTMSNIHITGPTAVSALKADAPAATAIYDLSGRQLQSTPRRGLFIQGGKKMFVK